MENFRIEDAKPEDVEMMGTIVRNSWIELYPNETYGITSEDLSAIDWFNGEYLAKLRKEITKNSHDTYVFVLKNNKNEVLGFCDVSQFESHGEIEAMYLIKKVQGKGWGRKLMEKAFEWLIPGQDVVVKVVSYNSRAISFYKKMGFKETGNKFVYTGTQLPSGKEIPRIEMLKPKS